MRSLIETLNYLQEFNTASVVLRLVLAMLFGGAIGLERLRKRRPAGFRTYMIVCLGATLSMLLGQYEHHMLKTVWSDILQTIGFQNQVDRFGAQVINGIGFLCTGTIIMSRRNEKKGLTTAAGLWSSACVGLAIGAGFYECVGLAFLLIFIVVRFLPYLENYIIENSRNISIYVEFQSIDDFGKIVNQIKAQDVMIYEVDVDKKRDDGSRGASAMFSLRMNQKGSHASFLAAVSELEIIDVLEEVCIGG